MSPRLLVIADLNMRQRGPCRVVRAVHQLRISLYVSIPPPSSYYYCRIRFSLSLSFPFFSSSPSPLFSLVEYRLSHRRKPDDVTCLITVPMKCRVRNNYQASRAQLCYCCLSARYRYRLRAPLSIYIYIYSFHFFLPLESRHRSNIDRCFLVDRWDFYIYI